MDKTTKIWSEEEFKFLEDNRDLVNSKELDELFFKAKQRFGHRGFRIIYLVSCYLGYELAVVAIHRADFISGIMVFCMHEKMNGLAPIHINCNIPTSNLSDKELKEIIIEELIKHLVMSSSTRTAKSPFSGIFKPGEGGNIITKALYKCLENNKITI